MQNDREPVAGAEGAESATPESGAVMGTVPAAAEAPPTTRGRRSGAAAFIYVLILAGLLLLIASVLGDDTGTAAVGTAICGVVLIALAACSITGLFGAVAVAAVAIGISVVLTGSGLLADDRGSTDLARLVAGAATFIGGFALLATADRPGRGPDEPEPGVGGI